MELIEKILSQSKKSNRSNWFSTLLACIFFFAANFFTIVFFKDSKNVILMFFIGSFVFPLIGWILGFKISKILFKNSNGIKFENSKLYKELKKNGYLTEFVSIIDDEINLENTIKYLDEFLGTGLLVTETWFIYIDTHNTIAVKTKDILKISEEFSTNSSTDHLCLLLKDNKCLQMYGIDYEDIEEELKSKYPNIIIGTEIIDEN